MYNMSPLPQELYKWRTTYIGMSRKRRRAWRRKIRSRRRSWRMRRRGRKRRKRRRKRRNRRRKRRRRNKRRRMTKMTRRRFGKVSLMYHMNRTPRTFKQQVVTSCLTVSVGLSKY